jgi:hypothetical protein
MINFHIIIPAYYYAKGINNILKLTENNSNIFFYIFDNTKSSKIFNVIIKFKNKHKNIYYTQNMPSVSPIKNWNDGLKFVKQKIDNNKYNQKNYYILLHQDEFFSKGFFKKLQLIIRKNNFPDIISCSTFVFFLNKLRNKIHTTALQRKFFCKFFFNYILKRNFIGPTSSLVIRMKNFVQLFDEDLKWFVDVKNYTKIFNTKSIFFTDKVFVFSDQTNKFSLTLKYKKELNSIKKKELSFLINNKSILTKIFLEIFNYPTWIILRLYNKIKFFLSYKIYYLK